MRPVYLHIAGSQSAINRPEFRPQLITPRSLVIAQGIAEIIDTDLSNRGGESYPEAYFLPSDTVLRPEANILGIADENDFFGGVVDAELHRHKAVFHPLIDGMASGQRHYSRDFARSVGDVVLPGYTAFSDDDATWGFKRLQGQGYDVRLKDPTKEGGRGQNVVKDMVDWLRLIGNYPTGQLEQYGVVLEPNLEDAKTLSVGQVSFNKRLYSYYGFQTQTEFEGVMRYSGTTLTMRRGGFKDLEKSLPEGSNKQAVAQARRVYDAYSLFDPLISRANFDVLQGYAQDGNFMSGVVDQSIRVGGATPAEIVAVQRLIDDVNLEEVTAQVDIQYGYDFKPLAPGQEIYFKKIGRRDVVSVLKTVSRRV